MIPNNKLLRAIEFAENAHKGQVRKGTDTPYIVHPKIVADLLGDVLCGEDVMIAGILHDTLEDTTTTELQIKELFGDRVLSLVKEVSEPDKSLSWEERKTHTIQSVNNISVEAATIMCADKLSNIIAMLDDLKSMAEVANGFGDFEVRFWSRFNAPVEKQKWYYISIADALIHKLHGTDGQFLAFELWNNVEIVFQNSHQEFLTQKMKAMKSNEEKLSFLEPYMEYAISEMNKKDFPTTHNMVKNNASKERLKEFMREHILKYGGSTPVYLINEYEKIYNVNRPD